MFIFENEVQRCIEKYNLSRDEATRIISGKNSDLSIQDLRYKYDNCNLGISFPDWITPENLLNMCYGVVGSICSSYYYWYYGPDEIAIDLFIWADIRLSKFENHRMLKKALCDQCKTIIRDMSYREAHQMYSMPLYTPPYDDVMDGSVTKTEDVVPLEIGCLDMQFDTAEFICNINKIADKDVRGILILGGYFLAGIVELFDLVVDLYNNSDTRCKEKIYEICKDDKGLCSKLNLKYDGTVKCKVAIGKILKIFKKREKQYLADYLLPYLAKCGLITM